MNRCLRLFSSIAWIALALSCGKSDSNSKLKRNAIANDDNVSVVRFKDGSKTGYLLISKDKGYEIVCEKVLKRKALIQATGFPYEALTDEEPLERDSQRFQNLKVSEQPKLTCDPAQKTLYRSELDGTTKYFFSDSTLSNTKLYMFGCQALIPAMGFDISTATKIEPSFIDSLNIFTAADENDINCLEGFTPATKLKWTSGESKTVLVKAGQGIDVNIFAAEKPDQKPAKIEVASKEGRCDWLVVSLVAPTAVISGQVPADFFNQSCKVTVVGEAGTFLKDEKVLTFTTDSVKPVLTSTCPRKKSILELKDFPDCEVSTNFGVISMDQSACPESFSFDAATGKLKLIKEPKAGSRCLIALSSDLHGVRSESFSIELSKDCPTGHVSNAEGSCQKRACEGTGHVFGDVWHESSSDRNGQKQLYCKADGSVEDRGIDSCNAGYELRSSSCLKSCAPGFLEGDLISQAVSNGTLTQVCRSGTASKTLACNSNYLERSGQCLLSCDGVHVENDTWTDSATNGSLAKSCSNGAVTSTLSCNSGYGNRSGNCLRTCDALHVAGDTWTVDVPLGQYTAMCGSDGNISNGAISCVAGYHLSGNACAPNDCGGYKHGDSKQELECSRSGEVMTQYTCEAGKWRKGRSTSTGSRICRA